MSYQDFLARKAQLAAPSGFDPLWMPDWLFPFQKSLVEWSLTQGRGLEMADTGLGKANPVSEPVLTPDGWVEIGDLGIGDQVIGSDGRPVSVMGIFHQGRKEIARVTFSDSSYSRCSWDHLWSVKSRNDHARGKPWRVMSTRDILASGIRWRKSSGRKWRIPMVEAVRFDSVAVRFDSVALPIEPYAMGVILGDGHVSDAGHVAFTTDREILDSLGVNAGLVSGPSWLGRGSTSKYRRPLCDLGLAGKNAAQKFLPPGYLLASVEDRLSVLRGLMDTDGSALPYGGTEFSSVSESLVDAVVELAQSLGGVARKKGPRITQYTSNGEKKNGKPSWRVNLKLPAENPFRLRRKSSAYVMPTKYPPARIIAAIEPEGVEEPAVCIRTDAEDQLYVTRSYILTHNTPMSLVYAQNVVQKTNGRVLILTPLAVGAQYLAEAAKFDIKAQRSRDGKLNGARVVISNYEQLHHFNPADFAGVVCDESGLLKNFAAKRKAQVTEFLRTIPYRLLQTATAAPNDFPELGTSAEALGHLGYMDMISRFFINDDRLNITRRPGFASYRGVRQAASIGSQWRFKRAAEDPFWRWVCSWARACRKPSDLGFEDDRFDLPPLVVNERIVANTVPLEGYLPGITVEAVTLKEQSEERRNNRTERCEMAAELAWGVADPVIIWTDFNAEADMLEEMIPGARQVSGPMSLERKEELFTAFSSGELRVCITKPKIGAWGLNWQHCNRVIFFVSHSFEQYYQAIRRCWRFGQERPVYVDLIATPGEGRVIRNLKRKAEQAEKMYSRLVALMNDPEHLKRAETNGGTVEVPSWLM